MVQWPSSTGEVIILRLNKTELYLIKLIADDLSYGESSLPRLISYDPNPSYSHLLMLESQDSINRISNYCEMLSFCKEYMPKGAPNMEALFLTIIINTLANHTNRPLQGLVILKADAELLSSVKDLNIKLKGNVEIYNRIERDVKEHMNNLRYREAFLYLTEILSYLSEDEIEQNLSILMDLHTQLKQLVIEFDIADIASYPKFEQKVLEWNKQNISSKAIPILSGLTENSTFVLLTFITHNIKLDTDEKEITTIEHFLSRMKPSVPNNIILYLLTLVVKKDTDLYSKIYQACHNPSAQIIADRKIERNPYNIEHWKDSLNPLYKRALLQKLPRNITAILYNMVNFYCHIPGNYFYQIYTEQWTTLGSSEAASYELYRQLVTTMPYARTGYFNTFILEHTPSLCLDPSIYDMFVYMIKIYTNQLHTYNSLPAHDINAPHPKLLLKIILKNGFIGSILEPIFIPYLSTEDKLELMNELSLEKCVNGCNTIQTFYPLLLKPITIPVCIKAFRKEVINKLYAPFKSIWNFLITCHTALNCLSKGALTPLSLPQEIWIDIFIYTVEESITNHFDKIFNSSYINIKIENIFKPIASSISLWNPKVDSKTLKVKAQLAINEDLVKALDNELHALKNQFVPYTNIAQLMAKKVSSLAK